MDSNRRKRLIVRWSFLTAGAIASFWLVWHLIAGEVPTVTSLRMTNDWTLTLPFAVSRWFDVLIGPLWSAATVLFFTSGKVREKGDLVVDQITGRSVCITFPLFFGLFVGLVFGLVVSLGIGLVFGLASGLVYGLVVSLIVGLDFGLRGGLLVSLGVSLSFGLVVGLGFGLTVGLPLFLIFGLACILTIGVPVSFLSKSWRSFGQWLLGKDTVSGQLQLAQSSRPDPFDFLDDPERMSKPIGVRYL